MAMNDRFRNITLILFLVLPGFGCGAGVVHDVDTPSSDRTSKVNAPNQEHSNWERIYRDDTLGLESITFANDTLGIATGASEAYLITEDGGTTWTKHRIGGGEREKTGEVYNLTQAVVLPSGSIYAIGTLEEVGSALFVSPDRGHTWNIKYFPGSSLADVATSKTRIWIVGNEKNSGFILRAEDKGDWKTVWKGGADQYVSGVDFVDDQNGWVVGPKGRILHSSDGGDSWLRQRSSIQENLLSISFSDRDNGYAVGTNGTIIRTKDGGSVWSAAKNESNEALTVVETVGENKAFVIGLSGSLLGTVDGGNTWERRPLDIGLVPNFLTVTRDKIWLVGKGSIFRSELKP